MTGDAKFNEVFFDRGPGGRRPTHRRGGEGWRVAMTTFMHERTASAAATAARPGLGAISEAVRIRHEEPSSAPRCHGPPVRGDRGRGPPPHHIRAVRQPAGRQPRARRLDRPAHVRRGQQASTSSAWTCWAPAPSSTTTTPTGDRAARPRRAAGIARKMFLRYAVELHRRRHRRDPAQPPGRAGAGPAGRAPLRQGRALSQVPRTGWSPSSRGSTRGRNRSWPATRRDPRAAGPGRPRPSSQIARIGARREVVWSGSSSSRTTSPTTPRAVGCRWPDAATVEVPTDWRSGYYEVTVRTDVGAGTTRSDTSWCVPAETDPEAAAARAQHQHLERVQRLRRRNLYTGGTHVSFDASDGAGLAPQARRTGQPRRRPRDAGSGHGATTSPTSANTGSPSGPARPAGPTPSCRSSTGPSRAATSSTTRRTPTSRPCRDSSTGVASTSRSATTSTGPGTDARCRRAVRGGRGNAAFLSGNTSFWQVRLERRGGDDRLQGPVRGGSRLRHRPPAPPHLDVVGPPHRTTREPDDGRELLRGGYHRIGRNVGRGSGGYTVYRPDHWVFEGTDVGYGDLIGADAVIVGYECDGCEFTMVDGLPHPTGEDGTPADFEILGLTPARHFDGTTARPWRARRRSVRGRVHRLARAGR